MMDVFNPELAGSAAASILENRDVGAALSVSANEASRLALALLADADVAADLAADLLERHAPQVEALERHIMYATARRDYESGDPVVTFELDPTTRSCVRLMLALKLIAAQGRRSAA